MIYTYISNTKASEIMKNIETNFTKQKCLLLVDDCQEFIQSFSRDDSFVIIKDTDMNKPIEELGIEPSKEVILV